MTPAFRFATLVAVAVLALAGCGSDDGTTKAAAKTDSSGVTTVDVTLKGETVKPSGAGVKIKKGQPLKLHITADQAGELHVHSSPEQHIEFPAGTTDKTLRFDQPGVIDIEDHKLDKLILQVQVR